MSMSAFFLKNWQNLFLILIFVFIVVFSFVNLTTWPKVWFDEGLNIEISHNFLLFRKLDILTAPGVFSGVPYMVSTSGYPLTLPLAGVFYFFGFGLVQARIYMLFWLIIALASLYYIVKSVFKANKALATIALVATFAPFYGNGLTAFGEVPGFVFLIWGMFFLIRSEKPNYWLTGLFFSLAGVAKPYLFLLFPAFFIFLLFENRKYFLKKLFQFSAAAVFPIFLWIALVFPNPLSLKTWERAFFFNVYHFGQDFSVAKGIFKNIILIFSHSTLIYFLLITSLIVFWFFKKRRVDTGFLERKSCIFFFVYAIFAFFYFLISPGWLRYLFGFELLAFIFLPPAIEIVAQRLFKKEIIQKFAFGGALATLLIIQLFQLFFFRSDFYSPYPEQVSSFIEENLAKNDAYRVGFLNLPEIAGLIDPFKKFHIVGGSAKPVFGENPLSFPKKSLPQFIVFEGESNYVKDYKNVLEENYSLLKKLGNFNIYELK